MSDIKKETPVLLLTGYLGSGKTTLVNHILSNERGIRFAVIVNDIGEVNIDASLIQKGGVVNQSDDSLVALQNGCICCTLKMDLVKQIEDIIALDRFDYIVIEASGICEPAPIAQTICSIPYMGARYAQKGIPRLDCIVTVVDALRLQSEFDCGRSLASKEIDDEDIENAEQSHRSRSRRVAPHTRNHQGDTAAGRDYRHRLRRRRHIAPTRYSSVQLRESGHLGRMGTRA